MFNKYNLLLALCILICGVFLFQRLEDPTPALYKGRFRPLETVEESMTFKKNSPLPSSFQLKAEVFYLRYDLLVLAILFYALSLFFPGFFIIAFLFHTALLTLRVIILERPPVSNMQESVLFVPWVIAVLALFWRGRIFLIGASLIAASLLTLAKISFDGQLLEIAPAVLNSRFWLTIHVLMVVSSYAFFLLAGFLAHIYLIKPEKPVFSALLKILYAGIFFLVAGTILGGIWAQASWGRFWDWDPKEAWAFISISFYLILLHLYRFGHIDKKGVSAGAILGVLAIGFTWYGVNYLLGTGLHSYGFGSGGARWFILFCLIELLFLCYFCLIQKRLSVKGSKKE